MKQFYFAILALFISQSTLLSEEFSGTAFFSNIEWPKTDFSKRNISFEEILSGGPPKDGIPAIDDPKFVKIEQAQQWLDRFEPVISVELNGNAKAYPLQILMFHEIVNDEIDGQAISVTFCPLCNTSIVFSREVDGKRLDFGTTGRLRNSDLIMYDRQTESWWQQFTGEAMIGYYTGMELTELNSQIISFENYQKRYPNSLVLSRKTGFNRQYGNNPYRGYDHIDNVPFLMRGPVDGRLPPMERVLSVKIKNKRKLYPFSALTLSEILHDNVSNAPLVIFKTGETYSVLDQNKISASKKIPAYTVFSSQVKNEVLHFYLKNGVIRDRETNSLWDVMGQSTHGKLKGQQLKTVQHGIHFAFAWLAFNPDVEIYTTKE